MRIDRFFEDQPPIEFVESLKSPVHTEAPYNFGSGAAGDGEVDVTGIYLREKFDDPDGLLNTAYDDFECFLSVCKISGKRYPIDAKKQHGFDLESHEIEVREDGLTIFAGDTEGVRRALVYLEGEMTKHEGAILHLGKVRRDAHIKARITRGFFSPTNRAPKWGDELLDDVDYYPDEYLNRLAHSNTNGLWIYTSFRALMPTPYFPERTVNNDGLNCQTGGTSRVQDDSREKAAKRIEKLRRVVEKCKRYGVKVYVFAIEPMGLLPWEIDGHTDMLGAPRLSDYQPICLRSEAGRDYVLRSLEGIFKAVPDLAGYIDITAGERPTSCSSIASFCDCPRCSKYSRGENLAYAVDVIKEGIRRAGTGAEFVSWTYGHRYWEYSDIEDYVRLAPSDVTLMQNFEDRGYDTQLGRERVAYDYWLSYVGPSELFEKTAVQTKEYGKRLWAKMQVCCSHELATVPYIPAPGIIFDKYRAARAAGVDGIMECWYFGNYPSIMSRMAGELSFMDGLECASDDEKERFILDFAARQYGKSLAPMVAEAWRHFEAGYRNYPTNIMFSYYGPMHDGIAWELSLIPKNNPLPRSWLLPDVPDGDRIGECLFAGHTLDEAIELCRRMRDGWAEGVGVLPLPESDEGASVARAIGLLSRSAVNILEFYRLRALLGRGVGDAEKLLGEMESIVKHEIDGATKMIALCEGDKRLGYHSEAEGFKFFPKKLAYRIESLKKLLATEFAEVRARIADGKPALGYYYAEGAEKIVMDGKMHELEGGRGFGVSIEGDEISLDVKTNADDALGIYYEFELFSPECGIVIDENATGTIHIESVERRRRGISLDWNATSHQSVLNVGIENELGLYRYVRSSDGYTVYRRIPACKWNGSTAIKLRLKVGDAKIVRSADPVSTLGKSEIIADEYVFLVPEKK